jgi:predicted kinase
MLIIFGGLPASGKTMLSRALSERLAAVHLRVDTIEHALKAGRPGHEDIGPQGYLIAYAVAADNLRLGHIVIADSVNPLPVTREAWRAVAAQASVAAVEVEIVCSDRAEHRRRVETRTVDIAGFVPPTWNEVEARDYRPWPEADLVVNTSARAIDDCLAELLAFLDECGIRPPT